MDESKLFTTSLEKSNNGYYFKDVCKLYGDVLVTKYLIPQLSIKDEENMKHTDSGTYLIFYADEGFKNIDIIFRALEVDN